MKINWCFRRICRPHLQGRRISQARNQREVAELCLTYSLTLKMEMTCFSEMSVDFQWTTGHYTPEGRTPHSFKIFSFTLILVTYNCKYMVPATNFLTHHTITTCIIKLLFKLSKYQFSFNPYDLNYITQQITARKPEKNAISGAIFPFHTIIILRTIDYFLSEFSMHMFGFATSCSRLMKISNLPPSCTQLLVLPLECTILQSRTKWAQGSLINIVTDCNHILYCKKKKKMKCRFRESDCRHE
jgi:hypothetical protein